jgi:hypothetical protein
MVNDDDHYRRAWPGNLSMEDLLLWNSLVVQRSLTGQAGIGPLSEERRLMDLLHRGTTKGMDNLDRLSYASVASNQYSAAIGDRLLAMWRAEKQRVSAACFVAFGYD